VWTAGHEGLGGSGDRATGCGGYASVVANTVAGGGEGVQVGEGLAFEIVIAAVIVVAERREPAESCCVAGREDFAVAKVAEKGGEDRDAG